MQPLITTHDYFSLSSFLNYQLSGLPVNWRAVLSLMKFEGLQPRDEDHVLSALDMWLRHTVSKRGVWGPLLCSIRSGLPRF
jgi:hypothetical protein